MEKRLRIEKAFILHRIYLYLIDIAFASLATISLYFLIISSVFGLGFNYYENKDNINRTLNEFNLTLKDDLSYDKYEGVIQDFYFNKYENEIIKDYKESYKKDYTIYHIYNVVVLGLPTVVNGEVSRSDYFEYVLNEDNSINYDVVAKTVPGSGRNYEKNMHDIFYNQYKKLNELLKRYNKEYFDVLSKNNLYETISRASGILFSLLVFFVIIPLTNKSSQTLAEKLFKIGNVEAKNGYTLKKYKVILRCLITYLLPSLGVIFLSMYSFIILTIGLLFLNLMIMILSSNNKDISQKILKIDSVDLNQSLIFKNKSEEKEFEKENNIL